MTTQRSSQILNHSTIETQISS